MNDQPDAETQNTHRRQTPTPMRDWNSQSQQTSGKTEALDRAATRTGTYKCDHLKIIEICQKQCVFMLRIYCKLLNKKNWR